MMCLKKGKSSEVSVRDRVGGGADSFWLGSNDVCGVCVRDK